MKLLVVGSSPQSNIYLNSQFVSGYHAELVILDNGDVMLTDRGSTNGTFINGSRISPNVDVMLKRGDNVKFADMDLDWNRVPELRPDPDTKKLIGLGSHSRNQVHVSGTNVSRFHATIKQTTDGKWFICDHSTNGTTVNGNRLPKDTFIRIKKGDEIKCAGIPVTNPVTSGSLGKGWIVGLSAAAACLLIAGLFFLIKPGNNGTSKSGQVLFANYAPSTVLIYMGYHYKVSAGSLDVVSAFGADEFIVKGNTLEEFDGESHEAFATGFYISPDGLIATNLHVARPWEFDEITQPVEDLFRAELNDMAQTRNPNYANYISQVKVEGVVDFTVAIAHNEYFDGHNAMSCMEVKCSNNPEIDVAILKAKLPGHELPKGTTYIDLNQIPQRDKYKPGMRLCTIGFPMAITLQNIEKKELQARYSEGTLSASNNDFDFGHTADVTNGSSGSPVFNANGQLIGIVSSGYGNGFNYAVRAEYIKKLLEKNDGAL